jgi:hypothetical protein
MGVHLRQDAIDPLAADLAARLARAHEELEIRMLSLGLHASDGWQIREEIQSGMTGTGIVLRPFHTFLHAPNIETTVQIGCDGRPINEKPIAPGDRRP